MATTQLFVELLVVGVGVATWLALALAVTFGVRWDPSAFQIGTVQITVLLGVSYVLGILVDRAAYRLFQPLERRRCEDVFGPDPAPPVSDRERAILVRAASLREQILYNRSRLRICRSWILNFALIALFSGVWAASQRALPLVVVSVSSAVLTVVAAAATNSLARDHYNNIRYSFEFLEREHARGEQTN